MKAISKRMLNFLKDARNTAPHIRTRAPLVFRDPTDDGPEVEILRKDKLIVRQGDDFVLGYQYPRPYSRINKRFQC